MKTFILILLSSVACFGEGTISPVRDTKGFVGGTFIGNGSGITNMVANGYYLSSSFTSSSTTLANTDLSVQVIAGRKYTFKAIVYVSDSVAAEGVKIDFDGGTATATIFRAHATGFDTALSFSTQVTALATDILTATFTGSGAIEVFGSFEPATSGSFVVRAAQNTHATGTLTVFRGSHIILSEMP